jgi:branched-chain amino acid transport system permease protein
VTPGAVVERFRVRTATGAEGELWGLGSVPVGLGVTAIIAVVIWAAAAEGIYYQTILGTAGAYLAAAVGYNLLLGYAGQFAFAQAGFMACGAYVFAVLEGRGWHELPAAAAGIAAAGVFAGVISIAVARTRDLYLALLTLAVGQAVLVAIDLIPKTGGDDGIVAHLNSTNAYVVALTTGGVSVLVAHRIVRSRSGRAFNMVRTNERAAVAMGARVGVTRVVAFVASGVLGGAGGVALAGSLHYISPPNFTLDMTLLLLTVVVVGGLGSLWGTILGVALITFIQQELGGSGPTSKYVYGAALFVIVVLRPAGLASIGRLVGGRRSQPPIEKMGALIAVSEPRALTTRPLPLAERATLLEATGIRVAFGGVTALDGVDFAVPKQSRIAVVGPNGAGKTTLLNAISGLVKPKEGSIRLDGLDADLVRQSPARRSGLGIARTFQDSALFSGQGMTVADQLLCGAYARTRYTIGGALLRTPPMLREERRIGEEARELLAELDLEALAYRQIEELAGPDRRLVDLARALMARPRLLLLDEIAAGMSGEAKSRLSAFLRARCDDRDMALVVIEHDIEFVRGLAEHVVVLSEGRVIAEGEPAAVFARAEVMEAYVGADA